MTNKPLNVKPGDRLTLRNGMDMDVFAVHPEQDWAIFGQYKKTDGKWHNSSWSIRGHCMGGANSDLDIMPPEPKTVTVERWFVWFDNGVVLGDLKELPQGPHIKAIVRREITITEGEGLE